jgi:hypothetical protein
MRRADDSSLSFGGAVLLSLNSILLSDRAPGRCSRFLFRRKSTQWVPGRHSFFHRVSAKRVVRLLFLWVVPICSAVPGIAQKASQATGILPIYDTKTEAKVKGTVDEVNILPLGTRKDLRELILKSGEEKIYIYVCPETFEKEMGISFSKGDEIAVTGSKVKQEELDVVLARELTKGTDTLVFRDGKGNPVWDPRTGK